ncbi:MAG: hypothetical protein GXY51_02675 [Bacteroidetes bacterium]|nr:hypothetical protein [Bacteroidota bacterium]
MSIRVLARGMMREYQIDYETAKKIYEIRATKPFLTPRDFKRGESLLKKIIGGNGNGNSSKERKISQGAYSL